MAPGANLVVSAGFAGRLLALALVGLMSSSATLAAEPVSDSPHEVIRATSKQLVALIDEARGYVDETPGKYHAEAQALLDPVVDFRSFSRLVMASHLQASKC